MPSLPAKDMSAKCPRLLILNDLNRADPFDCLLAQGYAYEITSEENQAIAWLNTQPFDLVLLAASRLSNRDTLLTHIKTNAQQPNLPIVIFAHPNEMEILETCLVLGADDYLTLPCRPALLSDRIKRCLEHSHLQAQVQRPPAIERVANQSSESAKMADDLTQTILPLGIALSAEKDFNKLSERILNEAKSICNADAGTLYLRDQDNRLAFAIMRTDSLAIFLGGTTGQSISLPSLSLYHPDGQPNYRNVATYVAISGESIHIPDIYQAEGFDFSGTREFDRQNGYRTISCLTVPLKNYDGVVIGILQLLNAKVLNGNNIIPFSPYQCQVVECLSGQAAIALNNQLLLQRQKHLLKGERDLQIGRMIQADFLPETLPQRSGWEIAASFHPARQVAGDFYDAFTMLNDKIGIVIADVCDKGVGAALFMSLFRSLIRVLAQQKYSLELRNTLTDGAQVLKNTVELTNNYIADNHSRSNMFATLFFGVLDPATGQLLYINGGHEAPIICGVEGIKAHLRPTGPAVGIMPQETFRVEEILLNPGDILLAYTDGVPEARSPSGQFFKHSKLCDLLEKPLLSATDLLVSIEANVCEFMAGGEPFDDITMIAVQRKKGLV
jgi:phosphoserine phosphatase RsbU/P